MATAQENKTKKIIYWIGIGLLSALFLTSGFMEVTKNPLVYTQTINLGYPPHFITLLGIFKISGIIILFMPPKLNGLKEWVFAGLIFDVIFAVVANYSAGNISDCISPAVFFLIILGTYIMFHKINPAPKFLHG